MADILIGIPFLGIFDFFADFNLILKLFVFMTIVSWVRNHLGTGALSWILIAGMAYFIMFDGWALFGPIYVLYMLLMFGISGILIDFFFIAPGGAPPPPVEGMESPVSSGVDIQKRQAEHAARHGSIAGRIAGR